MSKYFPSHEDLQFTAVRIWPPIKSSLFDWYNNQGQGCFLTTNVLPSGYPIQSEKLVCVGLGSGLRATVYPHLFAEYFLKYFHQYFS